MLKRKGWDRMGWEGMGVLKGLVVGGEEGAIRVWRVGRQGKGKGIKRREKGKGRKEDVTQRNANVYASSLR